jgi:hypothetical protein
VRTQLWWGVDKPGTSTTAGPPAGPAVS